MDILPNPSMCADNSDTGNLLLTQTKTGTYTTNTTSTTTTTTIPSMNDEKVVQLSDLFRNFFRSEMRALSCEECHDNNAHVEVSE